VVSAELEVVVVVVAAALAASVVAMSVLCASSGPTEMKDEAGKDDDGDNGDVTSIPEEAVRPIKRAATVVSSFLSKSRLWVASTVVLAT
jgi:hypothetical protein